MVEGACAAADVANRKATAGEFMDCAKAVTDEALVPLTRRLRHLERLQEQFVSRATQEYMCVVCVCVC